MLKLVRTVMLALFLISPLTSSSPAADVPYSPYLKYLYLYADAMLAKGRDVDGPQKTGLFLSAMDRDTLLPLTTRPASPAGIRREDRNGLPWEALVGANPQHDENFLRLLYSLSEMSQKPVYRAAADAELKWFIENAGSPKTHLLAWGEHLSWNVMTGKVIGDTHEFARPWMLWERCFELSPEASKRAALGLWEHQINDQKNGSFDRHASYAAHGPGSGRDYPRHAGFYIRTWAEAYKKTKDPVFLTAIDTLLAHFEKKRDARGFVPERLNVPVAAVVSSLSMAIDCEGAAACVPDDLAKRLRKFTTTEDQVFCSLPHALKDQCGFIEALDRLATSPASAPASAAAASPTLYTPLWEGAYGGNTTAGVAMMCVSRYENGGGPAYRDLIRAAADCYLSGAPTEDVDMWPMTLSHVISLELSAWRITTNPQYLRRAQELGNMAISRYWEDKPLPRASLKTGHYEAITGADSLAVALLDLHLTTLHIAGVRPPCNTIDR